MQRVAMGTAWKLYFCPHSVPHGTSWLLVPKPSSPQHQSPPESTQKTCGCSARTTCLSSLFWFVNVIIQKHIYHPNLSQMSWCWLHSGLASAGWRGARSLPSSALSGAGGLALLRCLCLLPVLPARRFSLGSCCSEDALRGCNLKTSAVAENDNEGVY